MTQLLIGVSGKAETGKDYVATNYLKPRGFRPWSLAWHFKIWIVGQGLATYEEVFFTKPPAVRQLLQEYGTEKGRKVYGDDIWTNTAAAWIRLMGEQWGQRAIVIPDVRFPNEVAMIHRLGGKVMRLEAPTRAAQSRLTPAARAHESETALDHCTWFDVVIKNDPGDPDPGMQVDWALNCWGWTPEHQHIQAAA